MQSNSEETSDLDGETTDTVIAAADLTATKPYLVMYSAAYGGVRTDDVVGVRVEYGDTVIARGSGEGSSTGLPRAMRIGSLHGFYVLEADDVSDLAIKFTTLAGATAHVAGKSLVAIPLRRLRKNRDYWVAQTNGDEADLTTTRGLEPLVSFPVRLPKSGDYLVLMSAEGWVPEGDRFEGEAFQAVINGVPKKAMMGKEWETNHASRSFSYAKVHSLARGTNTFVLAVGAAQGRAEKAFRRGRIVIIRAKRFKQLRSVNAEELVMTAAEYPVFDPYLSITYEPHRPEHVVLIGNTMGWQGEIFRSLIVRLYDESAQNAITEFISDDAKDIRVDTPALSLFSAQPVSESTTFHFEISGEEERLEPQNYQFGDLIVWGMSLR